MAARTVFVYSGKGGVGKTTVAVNLAYASHLAGHTTGLFDADFEGPNVGSMLAALPFEEPETASNGAIAPAECGDVPVQSMEFLYPEKDGVYLSGAYLEGAIRQLLELPEWDVDTLFVDLPPGTGEIHRELLARLDGKAVVVSTAHSQSASNAGKGIEMLNRFGTEVLGVIDNFAYRDCGSCGARQEVFPGDSIEWLCEEFGVGRIARLPLDTRVSAAANRGEPFVWAHPDDDLTERFERLGDRIRERSERGGTVRPTSG